MPYPRNFSLVRIGQILTLLFLLQMPTYAQESIVTVYPVDNHAGLINPDMGIVGYYYNNELQKFTRGIDGPDVITEQLDPVTGTSNVIINTAKFSQKNEQYISKQIPGLSIMYLRLAWRFLEPTEGNFRWDIFDTQINRWSKLGLKLALRVTASETLDTSATPKWVFDQGATFHRFDPQKRQIDKQGKNVEPDFDNPIFLKKLQGFLAAYAKKYDGDPRIAYIDIGSFGAYGEGQTSSTTKLSYTARTIQKHIDLHLQYFHRTPLVVNHGFADHNRSVILSAQGILSGNIIQRDIDILRYAQNKGLLFRDDSIMVSQYKRAFYDQKLATLFYQQSPVILESGNYSAPASLPNPSNPLPYTVSSRLVKNGWYAPNLYYDAVEAYHASYVGANWYPVPAFLDLPSVNWFSVYPLRKSDPPSVGLKGLIQKIAQRLGYRLQFTSVSWPKIIKAGLPLQITFSTRNNGVAPCYRGGHAGIGIIDAKGTVIASKTDATFNVHDLPVSKIDTAKVHSGNLSFTIPHSGKYSIGVFIKNETGYFYNMPYDHPINGIYPVGEITVK